jgi:nucleotide-binding universal stress UspA family protein
MPVTVITVPVANRPECVHALTAAFELSSRLGAQVSGYHLHPHKYDSKKIPSKKGPGKEAFKLFEEAAEKAGVPIKAKVTTNTDPSAHWTEILGTPDKVMPIIAPMSDIVVVSRPKGTGKGPRGKVARDFLLQALQAGGRPTLILPQKKLPSVGKRVLIAWDQSRASIQALMGALPILKQADEVVLHCAGASYHTAPKAHHAKDYLAMHGIKARSTTSKGVHVNDDLMEAYSSHGCDLLVMGAYSRSRLMEQILGGTSEHFIMNANIPVLATHPVS